MHGDGANMPSDSIAMAINSSMNEKPVILIVEDGWAHHMDSLRLLGPQATETVDPDVLATGVVRQRYGCLGGQVGRQAAAVEAHAVIGKVTSPSTIWTPAGIWRYWTKFSVPLRIISPAVPPPAPLSRTRIIIRRQLDGHERTFRMARTAIQIRNQVNGGAS
jgi:hypothetical protein